MSTIQPAARSREIHYAVRDVLLIADEVKARGGKLFALNIGDPNQYDFDTPQHLKDAVSRAMSVGSHNGYSPSSGIESAREAIRREAARKGIKSVRDAFVTTGASEAIDIALTSLCDPGDNVLCPTPGYPLYSAILSKLNVEYRPYYLMEEEDWAPNADEIAKLIDSRTRAIVLINPNNPTGSLYARKTLERIVEMALAHNIVVFADEIYDKLLLDGLTHTSIASLSEELPCITFNGISKGYLSPGWRIGWGIVSGPETKLSEFVVAINKFLRARLCASHPMQYAIPDALDGDHSFLKEVKEKLQRRRDISVDRKSVV